MTPPFILLPFKPFKTNVPLLPVFFSISESCAMSARCWAHGGLTCNNAEELRGAIRGEGSSVPIPSPFSSQGSPEGSRRCKEKRVNVLPKAQLHSIVLCLCLSGGGKCGKKHRFAWKSAAFYIKRVKTTSRFQSLFFLSLFLSPFLPSPSHWSKESTTVT